MFRLLRVGVGTGLKAISLIRRSKSMKTYNWWLGKKRRVRKKYTLFLGMYMSPKEVREWYKRLKVGTGARA